MCEGVCVSMCVCVCLCVIMRERERGREREGEIERERDLLGKLVLQGLGQAGVGHAVRQLHLPQGLLGGGSQVCQTLPQLIEKEREIDK